MVQKKRKTQQHNDNGREKCNRKKNAKRKTEHLHSELTRKIRLTFKDIIAKKKNFKIESTSKQFIQQNKHHPRIQENKELLIKGECEKSTQIRNEIGRDSWRAFLTSSRVNDLSAIFRYFAKAEERPSANMRP